MAKIQFQNISRGVATTHGTDSGSPEVGKPGDHGYQPAIAAKPIVRLNHAGLTIHGVKAGDIGQMEDGEGARHLEKLGLIKVISRDATPNRDTRDERIVTLEEKNAALLAENAALRAVAQFAAAQRVDPLMGATTQDTKKPAQKS